MKHVDILNLVPNRIKCPYCGKWHVDRQNIPVKYWGDDEGEKDPYSLSLLTPNLRCPEFDKTYHLSLEKDLYNYGIDCLLFYSAGDLETVQEHDDEPIITFSPECYTNSLYCKNDRCHYYDKCQFAKKDAEITFFGIEFFQDTYFSIINSAIEKVEQQNLAMIQEIARLKEDLLFVCDLVNSYYLLCTDKKIPFLLSYDMKSRTHNVSKIYELWFKDGDTDTNNKND